MTGSPKTDSPSLFYAFLPSFFSSSGFLTILAKMDSAERKLIRRYSSRESSEPRDRKFTVTIVMIASTPNRQQNIETMFFKLLCLSSAQKKNPMIGITTKIKLSGKIVDAAANSESGRPMVLPVPKAERN